MKVLHHSKRHNDVKVLGKYGICLTWLTSTRSHYYVVVYFFFDEICRRSLKLLNKCAFSDVEVVLSVAHYAVLYGRNHPFTPWP